MTDYKEKADFSNCTIRPSYYAELTKTGLQKEFNLQICNSLNDLEKLTEKLED